MYLAKYVKQPRERKRYDIDWDCWLTQLENINLAHAEVIDLDRPAHHRSTRKPGDPYIDHLVVKDVYIASNKRAVYFYAEGGEDGHAYKVTISVTTSRSQTDEQEIIFDVVDF